MYINRQTEKKQTSKQTDRQTDRQTNKQKTDKNRQANRQGGKQTGIQANQTTQAEGLKHVLNLHVETYTSSSTDPSKRGNSPQEPTRM